jgi:ATP/maltotriose-dependent transcriptional regulator MalT
LSAAFAAVSLVAALGAAASPDSACVKAQYFLLNRHLVSSYLDSCDAALAVAARKGTDDEERLALRAQYLLLRGELAQSPDAKVNWSAAARAAADSLRSMNEQNPLGHLWWAAAQGRILQQRGLGAAARGFTELRRENERALELDPDCALASFALGRMCEELPKLLGGGPNKAEVWFRRGVASDPNYTIIRLGLARVMARQGRRDEARAQLKQLLAVANPTNPAEATLDDRPAAAALLVQLGGDKAASD